MLYPKDIIAQAVELLQQGELVSFPTETVYGLGADATNVDALSKLYAAKGRPSQHPVIVHLFSVEQLSDWAQEIPPSAYRLAAGFWPGPLTMILKRNDSVLDAVTGGQETVGLRVPNHPIALALLKEFGKGIAAPSANRFGRLSPTKAEDVRAEFTEQVSLILDGGPCEVGIESTIIDLTGPSPVVLRPGMLPVGEIEAVVGSAVNFAAAGANLSTRAPGSLPSHYAPSKPLYLVPTASLAAMIEHCCDRGERPGILTSEASFTSDVQLARVVAEHDPVIYARRLYSNLRYLDNASCDCIIVESPPEEKEWDAIHDRLKRAAADK